MVSLSEMLGMEANENFRVKLLKQELKMRKKQPEAWTKTKYRPYANFRAKKREEVVATEGTKQVQIVKA